MELYAADNSLLQELVSIFDTNRSLGYSGGAGIAGSMLVVEDDGNISLLNRREVFVGYYNNDYQIFDNKSYNQFLNAVVGNEQFNLTNKLLITNQLFQAN